MRVLVWLSAGVASAVAAWMAYKKYGNRVELLYCDTLAYEHPDNRRFLDEIGAWIGLPVKILKSKEYADIYDVFEKTGFLRGPKGARCTTEMKKIPRRDYQQPGDLHIFGYTGDEKHRWDRVKKENPEIELEWILEGVTKADCHRILNEAGIKTPAMYLLGLPNNNCIGCVKAESVAYWTIIRHHFPEIFNKMAKMERKLNFALNRKGSGENRKPLFLDQIPPGLRKMKKGLNFECGVLCQTGGRP